jgi:hypothetical protein
VQLARLLAGCHVESLDDIRARAAEGALRRDDLVVSSDHGDLNSIAAAVSRRLHVDHP